MEVAEREAIAREQLLDAYEEMCPGIVRNPYVKSWPLPAQWYFLSMHTTWIHPPAPPEVVAAPDYDPDEYDPPFEALYGGQAGGGKSEALFIGGLQYVNDPEYAGAIFRRTTTDLSQPGALLNRAHLWLDGTDAHWDSKNSIFRFPSGAQLAFKYLKNPLDHLNYQGAEYQFTGWDELTQWPDLTQYEYVGKSRVRRNARQKERGTPLRTLAASNPGGPGHSAVMKRFIGGRDPVSGHMLRPAYPYVPASVYDNPHLDIATYVAGLMHLHPTVRAQLLKGDWTARDPGDYFRREWFGPLLDPETERWPDADCVRVRWWDLAASDEAGDGRIVSIASKALQTKKRAFTAGVLMARHRRGVCAVEHCYSFKKSPGARDNAIIQTAQADGFGVTVGLEIEGGSGGLAQFHGLRNRLNAMGYRVVGARPRPYQTDAQRERIIRVTDSNISAKMARADPVASCLEDGYIRRGEGANDGSLNWAVDALGASHESSNGIRCYAGPWTAAFLDKILDFPEGVTYDEVDAMSGAWSWLQENTSFSDTAGDYREGHDDSERRPAEIQNVHPLDRDEWAGPEEIATGLDKYGRFRP